MGLKKSDLEVNELARNQALTYSLIQHNKFEDKAANKDIIVVINMKEPSYRKRLYVWDLVKQEFIANHHVAHGVNSSEANNKTYAIRFSNTINSHESSRGAMVTDDTYIGKHGRSLRLHGLEKDLNDNVESRSIVLHAADYMTDGYIMATGRAGCSFGCPAVDPAIAQKLIDKIKHGVFLYVYF